MKSQAKRSYHSEARETQALKTRHRILVAAKNLFQKEGFDLVTIEKLAKAAKVSMPTIYALFQSKRGLVRALMDEALPPEQHAILVEKARSEKSAKNRLKIAAKISRLLYDAEREQMIIFQGASVLAPELKKLEKEREKRRYKRLEESINLMAQENVLPKNLSPAKAHDIFWAFTGRDMYRLFVIERGWTSGEYEAWLAQQLIKSLLLKC